MICVKKNQYFTENFIKLINLFLEYLFEEEEENEEEDDDELDEDNNNSMDN